MLLCFGARIRAGVLGTNGMSPKAKRPKQRTKVNGTWVHVEVQSLSPKTGPGDRFLSPVTESIT